MRKKLDQSKELRSKAEEKLAFTIPAKDTLLRPAAELLHELQVHQIELEMQNEDLRKAQAALEESRDRYLELYEFAPVGYLTLNRDGLISESNLTAATLLGVVRNKLLQRRFDHLVTLFDRDRWRFLFMNVMMHGGRQDIELVLQGVDDEPFYAHLDVVRIQPGMPPPAIRVAFTAVPERAVLKHRLNEAYKLLDEVQQLSKIGGWKYDSATRQITWTDETYRIYGVDKSYDPSNTKQDIEFYLPEDRPAIERAFERAVNQAEPYDLELRLRRRNGELLWVRTIGKPTVLNGNVVAVIGNIMDITDRKHNEEALRAQEQFFRMIAENVDDFIAVIDLQGCRLYNSPSYTRLFGERSDLVGSDAFAEIHVDDVQRVRDAFHDTVQTGTSHRLHFRLALPNGNVLYMESCGVLIRNSQGEATSVLVVSRDITERKQAEDQILNLAFCDVLTQLPNRRMLVDHLEQTLATCKRHGRYAGLMFIDLDNFKSVNDTHGHAVGDALLVEAAQRISACVREMDTVARFGGDEFVVLLSELSEDKAESARQATVVAEKIQSALAAPYVLVADARQNLDATIKFQRTASIGVVLFSGQNAAVDDILKWADTAMYKAKKEGSNLIRFFE